MDKKSIKNYLKPYSIFKSRETTIVNAFASALALHDDFDENRVDVALRALGQDPEKELKCVYCDKMAETWDHVIGIVKDKKYAGTGHMIGNLVPCCKECNSSKGNKDYREFLKEKNRNDQIKLITDYLTKFLPVNIDQDAIERDFPEEMRDYNKYKEEILDLMDKADEQADTIRRKVKEKKFK
jgi:hypothetical protein